MTDGQLPMTEARIWLILVKLAAVLTAGLLLVGIVLALVFKAQVEFRSIAIGAFLVAAGVSLLINGVLAALRIFDWFEGRRNKSDAS